jgi:hypothetical protein
MSQMHLSAFANRKPLSRILTVPEKVESVYSLTQHVWAGSSEDERIESKKENRVRLETLDEFFIDPVRSYLNRIFEKIALGEGQGFWVQAEFGVGKSHLLAATSVLAVGGPTAWDRAALREDEEKKAGPGARIDNLWRKQVEGKRIFPVVFSLEGCGGGREKKLEDFILDEAQSTFALREGKPLAVYPEEHLARLFLKEHQKAFRDDLRTFLADKRLMRGLGRFEYDELMEALKKPESLRDAGRVLMAFYRHRNLMPQVPTERGERMGRAVHDILDAGYQGIFIAIDEMSEYLRRSHFTSDDEDFLLALSSSLAKAQGLPIWTLVAAQSAHTNPMKIIGPDRLREELLEHKAERFRDIVIQRTRTVIDPKHVDVYYNGYRSLLPWVKAGLKEDFESSFPFPPDALSVIRDISKKLTGTRSTISFLHRALKNAVENNSSDLVPLWRIFDDLMSYNETPSTSSSGAISIRSKFRGEVAALEAAQATLKRITDGQLARPQNRTRAERILNTLFLYKLGGVAGLTREQILDAVCDLKPGEDELEAQLGHYETILDEMRGKLRNQIHFRQGRYEFVPKETGQYDDLVHEATERLKSDPQLLWQKIDRLMSYSDREAPSPFKGIVPEEDGRLVQLKVDNWHGQERSGRVTAADLGRPNVHPAEVDTHGNEDDFVVMIARRHMSEKAVEQFLKKDTPADPRVVVWAPVELKEEEKATLAAVLAHLVVAEEHKNTSFEKEGRREFKNEAFRAYAVMQGLYSRGVAKTSRTSLAISLVGGPEGAIAKMAMEAMDSCYRSRSIDFGNRKFDTQGAVKLINGLIKRGRAVSEGDQLWSAVENFADPLGVVQHGALERVDPSGSAFYREIRAKVEAQGGAGIDVRTVYNWFTGYDPNDGSESPGLTRRMVDVYLLCMAQQGLIRIRRKKGDWVDRSTIAGIDFKPEVLRNLDRIELPRALEHWQIFHSYLEVMTGAGEGSLGPRYDKASADEALKSLWEDHWLDHADVERIDTEIRGLFTTLGMAESNPFDELLIYWMAFADEARPKIFNEQDVFSSLCRAVLAATEIKEAELLTPAHLTGFRENHRRFRELRASSRKTGLLLIRAAKLAQAPLPANRRLKEVQKAQEEVLKELKNAKDLILNPDTVSTRLEPRLSDLERLYVPAYLDELMKLEAVQNELGEVIELVQYSDQMKALKEFAVEVEEARDIVEEYQAKLDNTPPRLRKQPEDRDAAENEVKTEGRVKDIRNEELTFRRLAEESQKRQQAIDHLRDAAQEAMRGFASFLKSPGVFSRLEAEKEPTEGLVEILKAESESEVTEILVTMPKEKRTALAKQLKAILGNRTAKPVSLQSFKPSTDLIWERKEIETVAREFREYLEKQWDDGCYIKIEK